jgi:branched-chain amino acid transport system substrate-binding protein
MKHSSKFKKWASAALVTAAALASGAVMAQNIKIGAINPYSGPMALYGTEVTRGYELAVDQINAAGGLLGRKVELVRGDASNPQQGIATVEQLAVKDRVDMFLGTYISGISLTASDAAMRYNKLYWETNAVAVNLTERGLPNFIRSGPDGNSFAVTSVNVIRNLIAPNLKKDIKDLKVWIEHEDSIYGTGIAQVQRKLLTDAGARVVGVGSHPARTIDLNDSVLRAKQAAPDVVVQTGYVPDGNLLLRTIREQGFKPGAILMVGTGDTPETLEAIGAAYLEGILVIGYPRNDISDAFGPGHRAFLAAYRAKYKSDPIAPQCMAAYSGTLIMAEAIKAAGSLDPEKVRAAAAKLDKPESSYPSGFGAKFDNNMQNVRAWFTASQWQSGKMVTVFPQNAALSGVTVRPLGRP